MNKKIKIPPMENTTCAKKSFIDFPLIEFVQSIDICKHIFSFVESYYCIFKFVSKRWYKFFNDKTLRIEALTGVQPLTKRWYKIINDKTLNIGALTDSICYSNELNLLKWLFENLILIGKRCTFLTGKSAYYNRLDILNYANSRGCHMGLFVNDFFTIQDINKVYDTPNGREYLTQFTETLLTKK